jgi:hypothetical protein
MQSPKYERWKELCEQPAVAQNPAKLRGLAEEIDRPLDEKYLPVKHHQEPARTE